MGTTAQLILVGALPSQLHQAQKFVEQCERLWSRFDPDSELSQLNNDAGKPVVVSESTYSLIRQALLAWKATKGVFDPTLGAALQAAGYNISFDTIPDFSEAPEPQPAPTPTAIEMNDSLKSVQLPLGTVIDLGGIAKGYCVDILAAKLQQDGVKGCLLNLGGDIIVQGTPKENPAWRVTLNCPGADEKIVVNLQAGAVCTSSVVKRSWHSQNGLETHIRDPLTGSSVESDVLTVSVICERATQGEVLAKTALLMGKTEGASFLIDQGTAGVMVDDKGQVERIGDLSQYEIAR